VHWFEPSQTRHPYGLSVSWRESLKAGVNGWLMAGIEAAA